MIGRVRGRWFPASVLFAGQTRPWRRRYVVAADAGLYVWDRPAELAEWFSEVDWARSRLPETDRAAKIGFDLHTSAGLVVVTLGTGCRCGALAHWAGPSWASTEVARAQ